MVHFPRVALFTLGFSDVPERVTNQHINFLFGISLNDFVVDDWMTLLEI